MPHVTFKDAGQLMAASYTVYDDRVVSTVGSRTIFLEILGPGRYRYLRG